MHHRRGIVLPLIEGVQVIVTVSAALFCWGCALGPRGTPAYWLTAVLFSLIAAWCVAPVCGRSGRRARLERQAELMRSGHCVRCGYDLHGLGRTRRCPECGAYAAHLPLGVTVR